MARTTLEMASNAARLSRSPISAYRKLAAFVLLCWAVPLAAQTESDLAERVRTLEQQVAELTRRLTGSSFPESAGESHASAGALADRVAALEVEVQRLLRELPSTAEQPPAGAPLRRLEANPAPTVPPLQAPLPSLRRSGAAASPSEESPFPISGYMELNFSKPQEQSAVLDFRRFVLLFGHSFSERLKFWSELELEHALVEGAEEKGELELEQAYVDFLLHPAVNIRGGMLLTPMGILNERHEPPSFYGVLRPQVDTVIIPSTWFDVGAGVFGDLGRGLSYKFYGMAPLDATGFTAEEGLRGGRQKGSESFLADWAQAVRFEYRGVPRLVLGTSLWSGKTGLNLRTVNPSVRIYEFDGRYRWDRLEWRGQFAKTYLTEAQELNLALERQTGVSPNLARQMRGFYLEGAAHILPRRNRFDLVGFARYENFDTQFRMPRGFLPLKQFDRTLWTLGASFYPHPDIAVKADYQILQNESQAVGAPNQFNLGLGWWF